MSKVLDNTLGYITPPLPIIYVGNGVYRLPFGVWSTGLPASNDYTIIIKGEKHIAKRFCYPAGQTERCTAGDGGHIVIPTNPLDKVLLDFTGMPLEPGDLPEQDGKADANDFAKIKTLMSKLCSDLTENDKHTADLDYNGCINVEDAFLMRKSLEIRYDEE